LPSQKPSCPHWGIGPAGQSEELVGLAPAGTGRHVPVEPSALQVMHFPVHALSQQTPSAQWPLAQSELHEQVSPVRVLALPPSLQTVGAPLPPLPLSFLNDPSIGSFPPPPPQPRPIKKHAIKQPPTLHRTTRSDHML